MLSKQGCTTTLSVVTALSAALAMYSPSACAADTAEAVYKAKCAMCHGPDGKGQTPTGKSLKAGDFASDDVQKMGDSDLGTVISAGKGKMPAYKALTPDQVKDLVAYVRSLGKKK